MAPEALVAHDHAMALNLLIVDDSELVRASLRGLVADIPGVATVHAAASLARAMACARSEAPDLVVLDLHLPDGNAVEVIPALLELVPGVQIAVLTNDVHPVNRARSLAAGAHWFFDKSTEFDQMLNVVRQQAALCQPNYPRTV